MSKVRFEEEELMIVALFQEKTRQDTILLLQDTLGVLKETSNDISTDELVSIVSSTIDKLQQIEDKYYYSLDLSEYLNNLEDDAYEE